MNLNFLLLRKIYLQKIGKTLNTSLLYVITNLIDHIEIYIHIEIFAEIAMHPLIRDIHDKQFDLELPRIHQLAKYYNSLLKRTGFSEFLMRDTEIL